MCTYSILGMYNQFPNIQFPYSIYSEEAHHNDPATITRK